MSGSTGTDTTTTTNSPSAMSSVYDYVKSNPDVLLRSAGALAPMFGASSLSAPLNLLAGATGVAQSGSRNKEYAANRAAAETAVAAYKKDPDNVAPPTAQQWLLQAGGGMPQQSQAIASQTNQDISAAAQDAARRKALTAQIAAQPLRGGPSPTQQMGGGKTPVFPGGQSKTGGAAQGGDAQDLVARLIAAMKSQGGQGNYKGYGT